MSNHKPAHRLPDHTASPDALVLPLATLNRTLLPLVGGKAAQLGELIRAGFAVPPGFCVTTNAYARVAASAFQQWSAWWKRPSVSASDNASRSMEAPER